MRQIKIITKELDIGMLHKQHAGIISKLIAIVSSYLQTAPDTV